MIMECIGENIFPVAGKAGLAQTLLPSRDLGLGK